jgi:hypothetical protein
VHTRCERMCCTVGTKKSVSACAADKTSMAAAIATTATWRSVRAPNPHPYKYSVTQIFFFCVPEIFRLAFPVQGTGRRFSRSIQTRNRGEAEGKAFALHRRCCRRRLGTPPATSTRRARCSIPFTTDFLRRRRLTGIGWIGSTGAAR